MVENERIVFPGRGVVRVVPCPVPAPGAGTGVALSEGVDPAWLGRRVATLQPHARFVVPAAV